MGRVDLIGPNFKPLELGLAVDGGKGAIDGVEALRNFDTADAGDVEARVVSAPMLAEENFEIGVEIHWRAGVLKTDVGQMSGDVAGGDVEAPAERDGDVGEIAADAEALDQDFRRGNVGAARTKAVLDIVVGPVADGLDALHAVFDVAELQPREIEDLVGVDITAGERVA